MTLRISHRGRLIPASPIRRLVPLADDARRRGLHVHHLNIGQPDIETPLEIRSRLHHFDDQVIAYAPSCGTTGYLDALRDYYDQLGVHLSRTELIATTGGSEAILFALLACADTEDDVLVVEPFYTNYKAFALMAGVSLVPLTSDAASGFHLPPEEEWERAITPRTRMVLLCNPNNPTGTAYRRDELEMVLRFCQRHSLFLLSDEVYREFVYDGLEPDSALLLEGSGPTVVVVDSLSKRYSACGLRLGSLATRNREVYEACHRLAQSRLSAPGLAQVAAVGLRDLTPDYAIHVRQEYQRRRDVLFDELTAIPGVFLRKPEGAFYMVLQLPVDDAEAFAAWLLRDFSLDGSTVMIAPAADFYATPGKGRNEARIAYVLKEEDLRKSAAILRQALEVYPGRVLQDEASLSVAGC
jgi:aspartate aminotransferase